MPSKYRFGAVIPAAGMSSRMGAFKPLLPYKNSTVIETAIGSALPYVSTAVLTVGNRAGELSALLRERFGEALTIAANPDYASTDMLRSVQLGLRAMGECDAFFLLPADMPLISGKVYEALIAAFDGSADVIYPILGGRRGHPPLINARLIPAILGYEDEGGLRAILSGRAEKCVAVSDQGIFTDLDTYEDYDTAIREEHSYAGDGASLSPAVTPLLRRDPPSPTDEKTE